MPVLALVALNVIFLGSFFTTQSAEWSAMAGWLLDGVVLQHAIMERERERAR